MASDGGDGQQGPRADNECGWLLFSIFPLFFLNFILYAVGGTYDDLSKAGPIFWSKLTPILYH